MQQINADVQAGVRRRHDPMMATMPPNQDESQERPMPSQSQRSKKRLSSLFWLKVLSLAFAFFIISILLSVGHTLGIRILPRQKQTTRRPPLHDIPKPPTQQKISVVIMNHDRPYLLRRSSLLTTLQLHPSVSEILLLHSNPQTRFNSGELDNPRKILDVDAVAMNQEMGLALRFHYCAEQTSNDWVLIVDDDIELDATAVDALMYYMRQNPKRIVGHFGRALKQKYPLRAPPVYDTKTVYGNVEVVLTKILLLEREVCVNFQKTMHLMKDFAFRSKPIWNGEDLFVNLVANRLYGVPPGGPFSNLAVRDLPVWEADVTAPRLDGVKSISGNLDDSRLWNVRCVFIRTHC